MELWEALSKRRKEIGMQYSDLERLSGLSISTIKKILGGHIAAPSYESVQSIAYAMKMSMAELDRMIAEPAQPKETFSDSAMRIAALYDSTSDQGRELLNTISAFIEKNF